MSFDFPSVYDAAKANMNQSSQQQLSLMCTLIHDISNGSISLAQEALKHGRSNVTKPLSDWQVALLVLIIVVAVVLAAAVVCCVVISTLACYQCKAHLSCIEMLERLLTILGQAPKSLWNGASRLIALLRDAARSSSRKIRRAVT